MKNQKITPSQLKSILDAQFDRIVIERFDIKEIRTKVRELRLKITKYFKNGQRGLVRIASNALSNLLAEIEVHHNMIILRMSA